MISKSGKTHILAACWNAQLHSRKNQPAQKPSVFSSFVWPLVGWLLFVCGFHLQDCISIVMHVGAGVWSEEVVPCWHLLRNKKTAFPCMSDPLEEQVTHCYKQHMLRVPPLLRTCKLYSAV